MSLILRRMEERRKGRTEKEIYEAATSIETNECPFLMPFE